MKKVTFLQLTLILVFAITACSKNELSDSPVQKTAQLKATWSSSDQWGTWSNGGYTLYNDVWGSGAGSQTIWANSYSNWGVWANHPNTGGIKSYPNCTKYVGKTLSSLASCKSSFNATTPSGGAWESTYDIWDSNNAHEIMLWMNWTGAVNPISSQYNSSGQPVAAYTNISVGGHTWNIYTGSNGSNAVYSFLRTSKTNSGTIDVLAIFKWLQSKGLLGNVTLGNVQYGFEITSSYGTNGAGLNYTTNSYSVSFN
jgi:Glycosyl hydrolase family 12.